MSERWEGWAVAVDSWLPDGKETSVERVVFRSAMLREWAMSVAPRFEWSRDPRTIGGTITEPEPLAAAMPFGELRLEWTVFGHMSTTGVDETLLPQIVVDLSEPQTIADTWPAIVVPLLHMLTVFVGAGDNLENLLYRTPAGERMEDEFAEGAGRTAYVESLPVRQFEWVTSSCMAKPRNSEAPHEFEHLIATEEAAVRFSELMTAWFALHAKYEGALFDYLSMRIWHAMTIEESFYRIARSLEVLHGIRDSSPRIPRAEFRDVKRKPKEALEGDPHREFKLARLSHADKPSLKERLHALLDLCGPRLLNWIPHGRTTWVFNVVKTRDQMTHVGADGPLGGESLYEAYHLLDLIMRSVLLRELGYSAPETDERGLHTRDARAILYRV